MGAFICPHLGKHMYITHDYQCNKCNNIFEAMLLRGDNPVCRCGSKDVKRLMSAPLFELKGNGWPGKENKAQSDCRRMAQGQEI